MAVVKKPIKIEEQRIQAVFGQFDKNIRKIEKSFNVNYVCRDDSLILEGEESAVNKGYKRSAHNS